MKADINFILIFILFCSCSQADTKVLEKDSQIELKGQLTSNKEQIFLKYQFSKSYPFVLRMTQKNIYVGDGETIYKFNFSGEFQKKIDLPDELKGYVDFAIYEQYGKALFYIIGNGEVTCFSEDIQIIYKTSGLGDIIKVDDQGILYANYQEYDKDSNKVNNKIKIIQRDGTNTDYLTKKDLAGLNFEIVHSNIMLCAYPDRFYILPLSKNNSEKSYALQGFEERVWFIGEVDNYYVFRAFDFNQKKDIISFYDTNLKKIKSETLNEVFENTVVEQRENDDFLMDYPSAIIYSFFNGKIYYLRNTNEGSYISKLPSSR